jgi:hypothetical protein
MYSKKYINAGRIRTVSPTSSNEDLDYKPTKRGGSSQQMVC